MPIVAWNDSLKVNIVEIDNQHKQLVLLINQLHDEMKQGKAKDMLGVVLNDLVGYAGTHFKTEERYFDMFSYDEASLHKKEHARLLQKLEDFKKSYDAQADLFLAMKLANFLSEWLEDHLVKIDRNFARQLLEANSPG